MILNNAPANEAIVSNVGEIGEFRIRNSAKAFNILSSGLYANKIRAIVRELSCNAVDSHTAAGRQTTPFDVHLPNSLEPYFSIRDYGTGLSHEQVTNIYTTYFESTKTDSNAFIGALGLGSKSPFSYTDNFTVTAIKDGKRGVYTAFINEAGVPSIAKMMEEDTTDPAGVEVKFAVNDRYDFDKFRQEARNVYKYFALRPVISGNGDFGFDNPDYETKDIIPGVHSYKNAGYHSIAIMGNIAYPIEIPKSDNSLGDLKNLLTCGLELHFGIGELDFQASREGLSYIPQTVDAIKRKLAALNTALADVLATEANAIPNLWDRAVFISKKKDVRLWASAVSEYLTKHPLPTYDTTNKYGARAMTFQFKVEDLAATYNIQIKRLVQGRGGKAISNGKAETEYADNHAKDANGRYICWSVWNIPVDAGSVFVINDIKTGCAERARYHFREEGTDHYSRNIWCLEKVDKTKEMDLKAFFAKICEPANDRRIAASALNRPEREKLGRNVTILKLERRGGSGYRRSDDDMVWRDAGDTSKFPEKDMLGNDITYYYVPLSGFVMEGTKGYSSGKDMYDDVKALSGLYSGEIYGVRKKDIADIRKKPNWKNFEEHIAEQLAKRDMTKMLMSLVRTNLDHADILQFNNRDIAMYIENRDSPYAKFVDAFKGVDKFSGSRYNIERLFRNFAPNASLDPTTLQTKYNNELSEVNRRYPLLLKLSSYRVEASEIAEYVNLIDAKKGI
jgi:hypothetical protein